MAVDPAVDHEAGRNHGVIPAGLREQLRVEGDFQAARDLEYLHSVACNAEPFHLPEKSVAATVDDVAVPARLHERDARRGGLEVGLIHAASSPICVDLNQGGGNLTCGTHPWREPAATPFSSIRTVTVGFGFAPNLLTLPRQALAG